MKGTPPRRQIVKTLLAVWRQLCYKLATHRFLSIPLKSWLWLLVVLPPLLAWIGQLTWVWALFLTAIGVAALIGAESARRKQYIVFVAAPAPAQPANEHTSSTERSDPRLWQRPPPVSEPANPLEVDQRLRCWVSGFLGVEGKGRALAGERASISYVRTREHIVMAQVRRTRFLLLAPVPKADVGYWYAFFHPRAVQAVRPGTLYCGFTARPGLEVDYQDEENRGVQLYLGFEGPDARQRVLDDLRRDVTQGAF